MKLEEMARHRYHEGRLLGKDPNDGRDFTQEFKEEIADAFNYSKLLDQIKGTNTRLTRWLLWVVWRVWGWETRKTKKEEGN